jgi:RimJ/RimL family protein N-acetyltransferase
LDTERLTLRPFCGGDFEDVHAYASVPENVYFMCWGPNSEEDTRKFLVRCEQKWAAETVEQYDFAVVLKSTGKVIGGCEIFMNKECNTAELGWILNRDYWRQGYTPEAAAALLRFCFEELKLHRVYATCNTENYGSYRVMEKIGMRREGHFIKGRFGRVGEKRAWYDQYLYAILDEEWRGRNDNYIPGL